MIGWLWPVVSFPGPQCLFYKMVMGQSPKKALPAPSWPVPPTAAAKGVVRPVGAPPPAAPPPPPPSCTFSQAPRAGAGSPHPSVAPGEPAGSSPPAWSRAWGRVARERPASREAGRRETARRQGAIRRRPAGGPSPAGGMTEAALKHPAWRGRRGAPSSLRPPPQSHPCSSRRNGTAPPACRVSWGWWGAVRGSKERCQWGGGQG